MTMKLKQTQNLILSAIEANNGEPIEVAYSGGKDSDVLLHVVRNMGVPYRAIHKCTTIDPPGTLQHCRDNGVEIRMPRRTFMEGIRFNGLPNRWRRWCCRELKEYKISNKVLMGVRASESTSRKAYEPTQCVGGGKKKVERIYPLLYWNDEDIRNYLHSNGIQLAPHYYNADGLLDLSRRLGCIGCPLKSYKQRVADFERWPKMRDAWIMAAQDYLDTHRDTITSKKFTTGEEFFKFYLK